VGNKGEGKGEQVIMDGHSELNGATSRGQSGNLKRKRQRNTTTATHAETTMEKPEKERANKKYEAVVKIVKIQPKRENDNGRASNLAFHRCACVEGEVSLLTITFVLIFASFPPPPPPPRPLPPQSHDHVHP
jgi:hypothetical protein